MVEVNENIDKFLRLLRNQIGIKKISEKELLKVMKYFGVARNDEVSVNTKDISMAFKFDFIDGRVFLFVKSDFKMGQTVYVCKKKGRNATMYNVRKKGIIKGIYDRYVTVQYDNYSESILYNCMDICEYLVFSGGMS